MPVLAVCPLSSAARRGIAKTKGRVNACKISISPKELWAEGLEYDGGEVTKASHDEASVNADENTYP